MVNSRKVQVAAAFAVIFFLVFAGMRIALLDRSPGPKPKPRAVLNQCVQKEASASKADCSNACPVHAIDGEFQHHCLNLPAGHLVTFNRLAAADTVPPYPPTLPGRSPPSS
ncbi:hypothetical protein M1B72_16750 [Geomonas paludis]|uniref:Uncharacterized protein n=1 Tax=Geomonas paludis TaxID=2740185 RepID=A0A6V8MYV3_9BACT|nr:hypothetical protein [Geomonas paludis]UPU35086.1 hypothetical protein M1B72_16750 [Geomonas paludis]GFO65408.1 hypothetical protein GMPD_33270 [Geomonas paludis]